MRNLKKILALVLALVMSLSLMATASAADNTAANDAATLYKTAGEVLVGLNVVKGDLENPNDYRFNDPIIRAEAAALIYRVHTADVTDAKAALHDYTPFTDLAPVQTWATGYISYAHNAEIVKGKTTTTFDPLANITGYETLAMTLRAMGYGKNGEFEGDQWRQNTASWAQRVGLLKGVSAADQTQTRMDQPATRGLVFQIMFNAMQLPEVQFSALNPYNYAELDTTLGQRNFGLEEITGVIKANEWANLEGDKVLDAGKTKMTVTAVNPTKSAVAEVGKDITLDVTTALADVGLREKAYMHGTGSVKSVIQTLDAEGLNTVRDNEGEGVNTGKANQKYANIGKLADGLNLSDALYFIDYDEDMNGRAQSKWLIRYAIAKASAGDEWTDFLKENGATTRTITVNWDVNDDGVVDADDKVDCWLRSIKPGVEIQKIDLDIMQEIFYTADRIGDNTVSGTGALRDYVVGEVYAGTSSLKDRSDDMAWVDFEDEFLTYDKVNKYDACEKGNSLRIIDNNNDGKAEYVLKVEYKQSKAVDTYKDQLAFLGGLKMSDYEGNLLYNEDELSKDNVGVIANYTVIDKKLSIWEAEKLTDSIKAKSYKDITVTTTEGDEVLGQSGIANYTGLDENNQMMAEKVEYYIYLDEYRNVRSYELAGEKQYALVTEVYYNGTQNWNYVTSKNVTVEAVLNGEETGAVAVDEYPNSSAGVFFSTDGNDEENAWTSRNTRYNTNADLNFLQPATAHLGIANESIYEGSTDNETPLYTDKRWSRNVFDATYSTIHTMPNQIGVFDYGNVTPTADYVQYTGATFTTSHGSFSYTNVANYVESDGALSLSTASKVYHNPNGDEVYRAAVKTTVNGADIAQYTAMTESEWADWYNKNNNTTTTFQTWFDTELAAGRIYLVYATDYVQLISGRTGTDSEMLATNGRHFKVDDNYNNRYFALSNSYVNTVDDTVFYVVTPSKVYRQVGFENFAAFLKSIM